MHAYQSWSVVFGEQPSAAKWNILGSNDASFNDGTGFTDNTITLKKLNANVGFFAYLNQAQSATNGSSKVQLNAELYDQGANFDSSTNYRFTAPVNGLYRFAGNIGYNSGSAFRLEPQLYKNGATLIAGGSQGADTFAAIGVAAELKLAANDYIELYLVGNSASPSLRTGTGPIYTYLSGSLIGEY